MLAEAGWPELRLPAIAQEDLLIPLSRGRTHLFKRGEALHPARFPMEELKRREAEIGSIRFAAQYLEAPLPAKGNIIKLVWLGEYADAAALSGGGQILQSWDVAAKDGERNDYSVCITALVRGRRVYILDVWREKVDFNELWKKVPMLARRFNANVLLIEDTSNGTALLQRLRSEPPGGVPTPIARRPKLEKIARLEAAGTMIEAGDLQLPRDAPWLATFKSELLGFPSTKHDDQVDALSQLMNWVDERNRRAPETVGPEVFDLSGPIKYPRTTREEYIDAWAA
jgi:predicted phage terminase large subunit-like protein